LVSLGTVATVTSGITASRERMMWRSRRAFTLLEVMIAVAFIGIAMLALMSLHRSDLDSVIRAQDLTRAAMLAQQVMSTAEVERFPLPGQTRGDFAHEYRGEFANFRWEREVDVMSDFPDMCRVRVTIFYGHGFARRFNLFEYMHNPNPPPLPNQPDANNPAVGGDQADPSQ
jgi:prepilin-type N-terminal cleavage/methylation domain-containing protein